jgi:hypothetical protein
MIPAFALRLLVGLALFWGLLPTKKITSGFFRIQNLLVLGLAVLVTVMTLQSSSSEATVIPVHLTPWLAGGIALLAYLGSMLWLLERRALAARVNIVILLLGLVALAANVNRDSEISAQALLILNSLSAAAILGALTGAMLLGHWYLTATGMSLDPLQRGVTAALIAVLARAGIVAWQQMTPGSSLSALDPILISLRWAAGIAGPLILVILTRRVLRYRNTQSATGVLFAAVILVFIGEAVALMA